MAITAGSGGRVVDQYEIEYVGVYKEDLQSFKDVDKRFKSIQNSIHTQNLAYSKQAEKLKQLAGPQAAGAYVKAVAELEVQYRDLNKMLDKHREASTKNNNFVVKGINDRLRKIDETKLAINNLFDTEIRKSKEAALASQKFTDESYEFAKLKNAQLTKSHDEEISKRNRILAEKIRERQKLRELEWQQARESNKKITQQVDIEAKRQSAELKAQILKRYSDQEQNAKKLEKLRAQADSVELRDKRAQLSKLRRLEESYTNRTGIKTTIGDRSSLSEIKQQEAKYKQASSQLLAAQKEAERQYARSTSAVFSDKYGTTFGHKFFTTAQYSIAAVGLFAIADAAGEAIRSVLEFDKATRTMSAVLDLSLPKARALGEELIGLGTAYGGQLDQINNIALSLGRAGIASKDLVDATEVVIRMAYLTGDSFEVASDAMISYQQVFGNTYSIEQLGDKLAYVANVSRLSTQDIGTFSNYALSAATAAGLTVDAVGAMAAAFSNAGVNASTIGTQIRRFTTLLSDNTTSVTSFFDQIGVVQGVLLEDLQASADGSVEGIARSNAAIEGFAKKLASLTDEEFTSVTAGMDLLARNSLSLLRQQSSSFSEFINTSMTGVEGQLQSTDTIIQSFVVSWEKSINQMKAVAIDLGTPIGESAKSFFGGFAQQIKDSYEYLTASSAERDKIIKRQVKEYELQQAIAELNKLDPTNSKELINIKTRIRLLQDELHSEVKVTKEKQAQNQLDKLKNDNIFYTTQLNKLLYIDEKDRSAAQKARIIVLQEEVKLVRKSIADQTKRIEQQKELETTKERIVKLSEVDLDLIGKSVRLKAASTNSAQAQLETQREYTKIITDGFKQQALGLSAELNAGTQRTKSIKSAINNLSDYQSVQQTIYELELLRIGANSKEEKTISAIQRILQEKVVPAYQNLEQSTQAVKAQTEERVKKQIEAFDVTSKTAALEQQVADGEIQKIDSLYVEQQLLQDKLDKLKTVEASETREAEIKKTTLELAQVALDIDRERAKLDEKKQKQYLAFEKYAADIRKVEKSLEYQTELDKLREQYSQSREARLRKYKEDLNSGAITLTQYVKLRELELSLLEKTTQATTWQYQTAKAGLAELESGMRSFFDMNSEDWLDFGNLAQNILETIYQKMLDLLIIQPIIDSLSKSLNNIGTTSSSSGGSDSSWVGAVGNIISGLFMSANGSAWGNGVQKFATGGAFTNSVVSSPTLFGMAGGTGMMGEAGPEAIMPLKRIDGSLGVQSVPSNVVINVINESGEPVDLEKVSEEMQTNDRDEYTKVLTFVMKGLRENRGLRSAIKTAASR